VLVITSVQPVVRYVNRLSVKKCQELASKGDSSHVFPTCLDSGLVWVAGYPTLPKIKKYEIRDTKFDLRLGRPHGDAADNAKCYATCTCALLIASGVGSHDSCSELCACI
jgi:hypothetical protein